MTKIIILPLALTAIIVTGQFLISVETQASNNARLNECAWYKSKAASASRADNKSKADEYRHLYRECMRGRID